MINIFFEHFCNCVNIFFCCVRRRYSSKYHFFLCERYVVIPNQIIFNFFIVIYDILLHCDSITYRKGLPSATNAAKWSNPRPLKGHSHINSSIINNYCVLFSYLNLLFCIKVIEKRLDINNFEGGCLIHNICDIVEVWNFDLYFLKCFVELILLAQAIVGEELKIRGGALIFSKGNTEQKTENNYRGLHDRYLIKYILI